MDSERKRKIKQALLAWPYNIISLLTFLGFIAFNTVINETHLFYTRLNSFYLWYTISFITLNLLIALGVALNISLAIIRIHEINKQRKLTKENNKKGEQVTVKEGSVAGIGIFTGLLAGSCPACFAGLLPAFLGIFGLSISISSLPLAGIELQILSIILLTTGIIMLSKNPTCKITKNKKREGPKRKKITRTQNLEP